MKELTDIVLEEPNTSSNSLEIVQSTEQSYIEEFTTLLKSNDRKKRHSNQTKIATILSCATVALVGAVALATHSLNLANDAHIDMERFLDEGNDYSEYTCDDIFSLTEANSDARCQFAQQCNGGSGLLGSFMFCNTFNLSLSTWCYIISPFAIIWLIVLFRMLGSTAEEFFSPSLEMFSMKMGLPPRFAGVTLLALGNGAADVSATISAIAQNPRTGYQMSLGALTGAGMFVGTIVAGVVIVVAGGVKCRGALVRDLCMFLITIGVVYFFFNQGEIGSVAINAFLWLYLLFVVVVLIADIYHRKVVLPRIRKEEEERRATEAAAASTGLEGMEHGENRVQFNLNNTESGAPSPTSGIELQSAQTTSTDAFHTPLNSGLESTDTFTDNATTPISPQGKKKRNRFRRGFDRVMMAFSNYGPNEGRSDVNKSFYGWSGALEVNEDKDDEPIRLHGQHGILSRQSSEAVEEPEDEQPVYEPATSYRALMEGVDNMCTIEGSLSSGMGTSWGDSFATAKHELKTHFHNFYQDIWHNDENSFFDKFFLTVELPFTIMRKLSITIPCDDYYCRALVAASFALAPIWIGLYAMLEHEANLFMFGGFPYIEIITFFTFIIGLFIVKFAPAAEEDMSLKVSVPLAFFGFIIAATWIDAVADQLVQLLTLMGVVSRIPGSIMGLTVLAWGNSMGDLSANVTMAKKGLANMAITACFAGPVFNILIGLGGGFASLNSELNQASTAVELSPSILVGLCFLAVNCLLVIVSGSIVNRGHIPKGYGYVAVVLYISYVVTSILLQIHQPAD